MGDCLCMILVTGATGTVGRHVVRLLREPFRAMSRNPSTMEGFRADFTDPAALARAVEGVRAVFLLTAPPSPAPDHDFALLAAARAAGVRRIVKVSAIRVSDWHRAAEEAVRESPEWTILRPSSFASNTFRWGGVVQNLTGTGRQGVVDPRDIAAVAVEALTRPGHNGKVHTLTGPELLDVPGQAAVLADVLGRPVRASDVDPAAARTGLLSAGLDPAAVEEIVAGSAWARAGHGAVLTDDIERILGRPAGSFRAWAEDHRAALELTP